MRCKSLIILKARRKSFGIEYDFCPYCKGKLYEWIPKPEIDGFGGKQDDSTIRDEVVREIINSSPKWICSKVL